MSRRGRRRRSWRLNEERKKRERERGGKGRGGGRLLRWRLRVLLNLVLVLVIELERELGLMTMLMENPWMKTKTSTVCPWMKMWTANLWSKILLLQNHRRLLMPHRFRANQTTRRTL